MLIDKKAIRKSRKVNRLKVSLSKMKRGCINNWYSLFLFQKLLPHFHYNRIISSSDIPFVVEIGLKSLDKS